MANRLRADGIEALLDQYEEFGPPEGWPRWMTRQIRDANFVVVVCTPVYYARVMGDEKLGTGRGVTWEGNLVFQHLYDGNTINRRFLPVLFNDVQEAHIPDPLRPFGNYRVEEEPGYLKLYRRLTNQREVSAPELGKLKSLPAIERRQDFFHEPTHEYSILQVIGALAWPNVWHQLAMTLSIDPQSSLFDVLFNQRNVLPLREGRQNRDSAIRRIVMAAFGCVLFLSLFAFLGTYAIGVWHAPDPDDRLLRNTALCWVTVSALGVSAALTMSLAAGLSGILGGSAIGAVYLALAWFNIWDVRADQSLGFSSGAATLGGSIGSICSYLFFSSMIRHDLRPRWRPDVSTWPFLAFIVLALLGIGLSVTRSRAALSVLESGRVLGGVLGALIGASSAVAILALRNEWDVRPESHYGARLLLKLVLAAAGIGISLGYVTDLLRGAYGDPVYAICLGFLVGSLAAGGLALLHALRKGLISVRLSGVFEGSVILLLFILALKLRLFANLDRLSAVLPVAITSIVASVLVSAVLNIVARRNNFFPTLQVAQSQSRGD